MNLAAESVWLLSTAKACDSEAPSISPAADSGERGLGRHHLLTKVNKDVTKETGFGFSISNVLIQYHEVKVTPKSE